jgi:4-amino-4-deoxy-L-arabinose transferase-like glycosyltransferase
MDTTIRPNPHRRELLIVLVMTVIGGVIRIWSPTKLGLIHFDEGIYALAGLWPLSPKGFWGIDPTVIAYAPGGYPFLVGLASFALGFGDLTPILVSILMGTLTIPLVAWLAWRTFGPTAGAITATFAAFSGFHIAFSRMALTDVSFLFFFILALGLGQRFLERPNVRNTIGLGIGVGLAQWFKYHGWLAGAIVALTALVNVILDPTERTLKRLARVWGQGACAALIALAVFWPWFSFVEAHGGYADLIRHHASYMQGVGVWFTNLNTQLRMNALLEHGSDKLGIARLASVFLMICFMHPDASKAIRQRLIGVDLFHIWTAAMWAACLSSAGYGLGWFWALGLAQIPWLFSWPATFRILGLWWLVFTLLTPLYHPYARLWLPLEALAWIFFGYFAGPVIMAAVSSRTPVFESLGRNKWLATWYVGSLILLGILLFISSPYSRYPAGDDAPLIEPSDSLRIACRQVQADLPKDLTRLRFLGRPPITFYLGTAGVSLAPQPDLDALLKPSGPSDWALVDDALLRQNPDHAQAKARMMEGWEVVREYPTTLNLPTFLDINPGAGRGKIEPSMLECPLWLLRPRSKGTP